MITQAINKSLLVAYKATLAQINLILQMTIQLKLALFLYSCRKTNPTQQWKPHPDYK